MLNRHLVGLHLAGKVTFATADFEFFHVDANDLVVGLHRKGLGGILKNVGHDQAAFGWAAP